VVVELARAFPKIAIGGVVGWNITRKVAWADQVFARVWPAAVHGFGFNSRQLLMRLPFHSVDHSTWEQAPHCWGWLESLGCDVSIPGGNKNLTGEVYHYLKMEAAAATKWAPLWAQHDAVLERARVGLTYRGRAA